MVAVIGDIHGCFYTLQELVDKIKEKYPTVQIFSVGDLVDRGNFSYEVIEFFRKEKIKFTPGNHDFMFYYFVKEPMSSMGSSWLFNGYETTLTSYDKHFDIVSEHFKFIKEAPLFFNLEDCFISHAGVSKYYKSKLPKGYEEDLNLIQDLVGREIANEHGILWTRDELIDIGKLQVVGHTRKSEVTFDHKNNAVYIDTSAYAGNKLSAVIVENNRVIDIISTPTFEEDIK